MIVKPDIAPSPVTARERRQRLVLPTERCAAKIRYTDRTLAKREAKRQSRELDGVWGVYYCDEHTCWHTGHKPPKGTRS